jgi:AP-3 complex subunit sigma
MRKFNNIDLKVMGGMVLETNISEIMTRIEEQSKIEKEEVSDADLCVSVLRMRKLTIKTHFY